MNSLFDAFEEVEDPRLDRTKSYPLTEILFLCLCAILTGMSSWRAIEMFGHDRLDWLRKYMPFENGIPSHQTIGRVMSLIKHKSMIQMFTCFMANLFNCTEDEIIAIDGKTLRHSYDRAIGQKALHILNVFAIRAGLCLTQKVVDEKTNEITAVPDVLTLIDIKNATVTTDALNSQKDIAEQIISQGGNYALPIKGNHPNLEDAIKLEFDTKKVDENESSSYQKETEKSHGRLNQRTYSVLPIDGVGGASEWKGATHIGMTTTETEKKGKTTLEVRYYLLSFADAQKFARAVRGHWGIENQLHWV